MNTITLADANRQTEAVKKIMAEQKLDFGPAYDVYIKGRPVLPRDMGGSLAESADD